MILLCEMLGAWLKIGHIGNWAGYIGVIAETIEIRLGLFFYVPGPDSYILWISCRASSILFMAFASFEL